MYGVMRMYGPCPCIKLPWKCVSRMNGFPPLVTTHRLPVLLEPVCRQCKPVTGSDAVNGKRKGSGPGGTHLNVVGQGCDIVTCVCSCCAVADEWEFQVRNKRSKGCTYSLAPWIIESKSCKGFSNANQIPGATQHSTAQHESHTQCSRPHLLISSCMQCHL